MRKLLMALPVALLAAMGCAYAQTLPTPAPASNVGGYATLSVTNSSARVALPIAPPTVFGVLQVFNAGIVDAHVKLGSSSVTATTGDIVVPAGMGIPMWVSTNTNLAAITDSGSTTLKVWQANGAVNPTAAGSAGGAATSVTQGTSPWVTSINPSSTAAAALPYNSAATLVSNLVLKSGAGNLYRFSLTVPGGGSGYAMIFDATAAPGDGAVTPVKCYPVPPNGGLVGSWNFPVRFTTGIVIVFSTTGCFTKTASATAFISGEVQ